MKREFSVEASVAAAGGLPETFKKAIEMEGSS